MTRTGSANNGGTAADMGTTADARTWTIAEVAEEFAITHRTVRHYEELNLISHDSILDTLQLKRGSFPFAHGARHELVSVLTLFDSYHCSRQNTNTGRL